MKLSDYVMQFLVDHGVRHVFTLTGGGAMHLNDSLGAQAGLRYICNLHEQACAMAAEAYAKYDHRLGVVLVTVGPGATNTLTGVAGAWLDSTPMLIISGQVKRADMKGNSGVRNRGVQEVDIITMVRSITKYAVSVTEPGSVRYHLEKAVSLALSGRPGPVWVEIPLDVQAATVDPSKLDAYQPDVTTAAPDTDLAARVTDALTLLSRAERPFLLLGNGVRLASALDDMRKLVNVLRVPFGLTWPALDFFPDDHPGLVGRPGPMAPRGANFALQNADCLLTIGARLDLVCTAFAPDRLARGAKKIMVDIDASELAKLAPWLDLPICADAGAFLAELLTQARHAYRPRDTGPWKARCEDWKQRYPLTVPDCGAVKNRISMYRFTETLCRLLPERALMVPASSGNAVEAFLLAYRAKRGQRVFITTALGSMGCGLPAAIGACLAHGGQLTVSMEGDGGVQMNIQELETVARLKLPIKMFVINNGGYGSIIASQSAYFHRLMGCTPETGLSFPDTQRVADAYRLASVRLDQPEQLEADLRAVLAMPGPVICEIMAVPDEPRQPRVSSYQKPDGSMASRPLEDMYPFLPREEFLAQMIVPPIED